MTPDQTKIFVYRLLNCEVSMAELAELSIPDHTDVNVYLLNHQHVLELKGRNVPGLERFVVASMILNRVPQKTYSEQEILAEFGIFT